MNLRDDLAEAICGALSGSFGCFGSNHSRRAADAILPIIERETTRARDDILARAWDEGAAANEVGWRHVYDGHPVSPGDMCPCGGPNPYRELSS